MVEFKSTTSNAAWWIKNPSKTWAEKRRAQSIGTTMSQDFGDLLRNMAMHGYSNLLAPELTLWEKLIWLTVHATTMCTLLAVLSLVWEQFVAQYIIISLHNPLYPVEFIPFPAISICSNNRISRQAAELYATELSKLDPSNRTADYFVDRVAYFENLFVKQEIDWQNYEEFSNFQAFLDTVGTWANETFFNTRRTMQMLSPSCRDLILECSLSGREIDCFGKRAFQDRLTTYGFCCTFNADDTYRQRSLEDRFVNSELGLKVILNTSRVDDFVPILNIDGYIVIVHDPYEFPDISSGESQELFLTNSEESFLAITPSLFDTEESLHSFGPATRKCYFDEETITIAGIGLTNYSFCNCITRCRIRSIVALCRCLPFYMPVEFADSSQGVVYCTLQHIECLLSYNFKWTNVLTQREPEMTDIQRALEEALFCPQCMQSCSDIQHRISVTTLPIGRYRSSLSEEQLEKIGLAAEDMSLLRVHFDEPTAKYYRRMVGNSWFEAMCTVGNVCSIFLGLSIVVLFEILFFITKYLIFGIKKCIHLNIQSDINNEKKNGRFVEDDMKLYICP